MFQKVKEVIHLRIGFFILPAMLVSAEGKPFQQWQEKNYLVYISIPLLKKRLLTPPLVESKCACYETLYVKHESFEYPSTTSHPRKPPHRSLAEKELLCKIFLHFKGSELIELKRLIDAAGGGHDLRHAVYSVITYEVRFLDFFSQKTCSFMGDFQSGCFFLGV